MKEVLASLPGKLRAPGVGGRAVFRTMTWTWRVAFPKVPVATRISRLLASTVTEASLATPVITGSPFRVSLRTITE